jgi:hypothetical protein
MGIWNSERWVMNDEQMDEKNDSAAKRKISIQLPINKLVKMIFAL